MTQSQEPVLLRLKGEVFWFWWLRWLCCGLFKASWDLLRTQVRTCLGVKTGDLAWSWAFAQSQGFLSQEGLGVVWTDAGASAFCSLSTWVLAGRARASLCSTLKRKMSTNESRAGLRCWQHMPGHPGVLSRSPCHTITGGQRWVFLEWVHRLPSETSLLQTHWQLGWEWIP